MNLLTTLCAGATKELGVDMSVLEHGLRNADLRLEVWFTEAPLERRADAVIIKLVPRVHLLGDSSRVPSFGA